MFHSGQRIVCVTKKDLGYPLDSKRTAWLQSLRVGSVYIVACLVPFKEGMGVRIVEIDTGYDAFAVERFRPVIERKTDISVFTKMLTPQKEDA